METYYASSTHGRIPLSKHAKLLMHRLRGAIHDSVRKGYYTYDKTAGSVGYTRGELAAYISRLEERQRDDANYVAQLRFERDRAERHLRETVEGIPVTPYYGGIFGSSVQRANACPSSHARIIGVDTVNHPRGITYALEILREGRDGSGAWAEVRLPGTAKLDAPAVPKMETGDIWPKIDLQSLKWAEKNLSTWLYRRWQFVYVHGLRERGKSFRYAPRPQQQPARISGNRATHIIVDDVTDLPPQNKAAYQEFVERWYKGSSPWKSWSGGAGNFQNLPKYQLERRAVGTASDTIEWRAVRGPERRAPKQFRRSGRRAAWNPNEPVTLPWGVYLDRRSEANWPGRRNGQRRK